MKQVSVKSTFETPLLYL